MAARGCAAGEGEVDRLGPNQQSPGGGESPSRARRPEARRRGMRGRPKRRSWQRRSQLPDGRDRAALQRRSRRDEVPGSGGERGSHERRLSARPRACPGFRRPAGRGRRGAFTSARASRRRAIPGFSAPPSISWRAPVSARACCRSIARQYRSAGAITKPASSRAIFFAGASSTPRRTRRSRTL